jgi:hypothetical protein
MMQEMSIRYKGGRQHFEHDILRKQCSRDEVMVKQTRLDEQW